MILHNAYKYRLSSHCYFIHHLRNSFALSEKEKKVCKMMSSKVSLAFFTLLTITSLILPSRAQDNPQDYLDAHNAARAAVGVGPLTWDTTVQAYAQNYANQRAGDCNLVHSGGPYGENLAWSSAGLSGTDAVKMWVDEKAYYDYNSNSCAAGQQCGHYTQVVWRNSARVGCAKVTCSTGGTFIGCNYDPPGNYVGEKPY
ncbi:pathogenesis-related protein 1-like [Populus alba x Populus x berolinensis]|nr:pathogenesis-related protein 1-like [Populus alba x Populus x berolinensis]